MACIFHRILTFKDAIRFQPISILAKAAHVRKYKWDSILDMAAVKGDEETIKKLSTTTEPALFCELELEI